MSMLESGLEEGRRARYGNSLSSEYYHVDRRPFFIACWYCIHHAAVHLLHGWGDAAKSDEGCRAKASGRGDVQDKSEPMTGPWVEGSL